MEERSAPGRAGDRFKTRQINVEELRRGGMPASTGKSLADLYAPVFSLILTLATSKNYGDPKELRAKIGGLFARMEKEGLAEGFSPDDLHDAKYALVAVIDETVSRSDWLVKGEWWEHPLALEFFGENIAGNEFFNKLEETRLKGQKKAPLLEVYYICLALGFEGKYAFNPTELTPLINQLGRELRALRGSGGELSPHWRPPEETLQAASRQLPVWGITALVGGVVFILFLVLKFILSGRASHWAEQIKNL
ncbi:MAG: type IVB secretion system protein IcmH/DotU [candidate division Zixibacteria bacterium]|nr:type IVB secretion system protein IcmH/DotU [candidate division Zixibacteria bacterium]